MPSQEQTQGDRTYLRALAERAARVQDLLGDLEVALLLAGDGRAIRLLGELKGAWRAFRDEAMLGAGHSGEGVP